MAKYKKDEFDHSEIEPSPSDCFKKFHVIIYKEVIGGPSHGHLLGVGACFSTKDAYPSNSQSCNKRMCLEREETHEQLKDQVNTLTNKLNSLLELVERLMTNNSNNYALLGPSTSMENVESWSDAQHEHQ
ncbi:hypothetical protein D8674_040271 [Pyrus ussuriensis x Pyrus communis]|uniref:Uncharacterized protein n=1 Tax=Pyrus ussuriensis x Pyrus communis TaxID=2448454 RepID=A0A5N5G0K0_9ROSA|nr:hypothetical protein D8674_040271 [Pyrus ussuriensis x Pyrus communis]